VSPVDAAHAAIALALEQLQENEEGMLARDDPEYLHQMRSSLRRIRSALRVFRVAIGTDLENAVRGDMRWLAQVMGEARDWDVLATGTLPPMLQARGESGAADALLGAVATRRDAAREALRAAIGSSRHAGFVLALARWLASPPVSRDAAARLRKLASRALRRRHRKFTAACAHLSHRDPGQLHRIRIEAKRLRYAVDALDSLYGGKRVKAFVRPLGKVQAALGDANDAAVAWRLIAPLDPAPELAQFARGWLEGRSSDAIADFERHAARLARAHPFWRRP
jgi:CHAD domain-containing protein